MASFGSHTKPRSRVVLLLSHLIGMNAITGKHKLCDMVKTKPVPSKDPGRAMSTSSGPERAAEDSSVVAVNQWPSSGEQSTSEENYYKTEI